MCLSPKRITKNGREYQIPCSCCYQCIAERRNEWTVRNLVELKQATRAYFITLTFDEKYIEQLLHFDARANLYVCDKSYYQSFLKQLRKSHNVRYFGVHEYGPQTFRPHYHIILYMQDNSILTTKDIERCWRYGFVEIANLNPARIHYCSKYLMKINNNVEYHNKFGIIRWRSQVKGDKEATEYLLSSYSDSRYRDAILFRNTFNIMSLKPAIGASLLTDEFKEYIRRETFREGHYPRLLLFSNSYKLPRYYIKKIFTDEEREELYDEFRSSGFSSPEDVKLSKKLGISIAELKEMRIFASEKKIEKLATSIKVKNIL